MNYRAEIAQMLRTMPSDWRRQYAVGRRTLERNTGIVLPDVPTPEQAMEIVRNTAGGKKDADQPLGNVPVPQDVRDEAMHGLRLSHRHNYGAWEFFGIARAIQLALAPAIPDRSRARMKRYLSDHAKDKAGKNFGNEASPSRGYMAWLNWGGDAGAEWVEGVTRASYRNNPYGVPMRRNPMSIVKDDKVYRILLDGRDTGKYATTREKAMEIALRMTDDKPAKKAKKAADPFAFRPFAAKKYAVPPIPPLPDRPAPVITVTSRDTSGPAPFKKDARTNWTLLKDVVANVPTWGRRSTFKVNDTRINVEPLLPAKGYSVFYVKPPGFDETDVAYLVRTPEGMDNRLISLYDITDAWMLTALDAYEYRRAPEAVLKKAVNDALKTHSLPNPTSYIL